MSLPYTNHIKLTWVLSENVSAFKYRMNLKVHLFSRILLIALICLIASAFYVLYQTDQQAISEADLTSQRIENQMKSQLLQMFTRHDFSSTFPNTDVWSEINGLSGSCIQFLSPTQSRHYHANICNEYNDTDRTWPKWFGSLYQNLFHPNFAVKKDISFNALTYGSVIVTLNVQMETARAWNNLRAIIGILTISIFAVCLFVYFTISRLLRPANSIVIGLEKMRDGQLDTRLASFDVKEWKQISKAINQLASSQEQIIADNKQLALKLMNVQEEEHRYIARELHDEFGQCLAGINAVTTSISQTAQQQCPELVPEIKTISPITSHMMAVMRDMLTRLRPAEVDDLGLSASIKNLVASWNNHSNGKTNYQLSLNGNIDALPEPLPTNIYRIVQECLTNIAKHAGASHANIMIHYTPDQQLQLEITDDGIAKIEEFDNTLGVGLLGIRERVIALGGELTLSARQTGGLMVAITIPILSAHKHINESDK